MIDLEKPDSFLPKFPALGGDKPPSDVPAEK